MSWGITGNSYYHTDGVRKTCHDVKQNKNQMLRNEAIKKIAEDLISRGIVQPGDILIPAPQHNGNAEYIKDIANMVSEKTGAVVVDVLKCVPHSSLYDQKKGGEKPRLTLFLDGKIPLGKNLYFIDNVISSGLTFRLANELLHFRLQPLVYAVDETKNPDLGKESIRNLLARKQNHVGGSKPRKRIEHEGR